MTNMKYNSVQQKGFFINYKPAPEGTQVENKFCGSHDIEGATCPNCKKPLLRFLTVNSDDKHIDIGKYQYKKIHFMYCWTCNISQREFFYQIIDDNKVSIIQYSKGGVQKDFPYPNYPENFPLGKIDFIEISEEDQRIISKVNSEEIDEFDLPDKDSHLSIPKHQFGGEPCLVQMEFDKINCPKCKSEMQFIVSIADDCIDDRGFVENEYVQVLYYYCKDCCMIGAIQHSD